MISLKLAKAAMWATLKHVGCWLVTLKLCKNGQPASRFIFSAGLAFKLKCMLGPKFATQPILTLAVLFKMGRPPGFKTESSFKFTAILYSVLDPEMLVCEIQSLLTGVGVSHHINCKYGIGSTSPWELNPWDGLAGQSKKVLALWRVQ